MTDNILSYFIKLGLRNWSLLHYVMDGLELLNPPASFSKYWDEKYRPPPLVYKVLMLKLMTSQILGKYSTKQTTLPAWQDSIFQK